jgi:hypothetical protein
MKINEAAKQYAAPSTKNIAELNEVMTDLDLKESKFINEDGKEIPYQYVELNGDKYRVPVSVLKSLKAILAENPNLKKFKVKKSGEGLKTNYTVIPLG